MKKTLLFQAGMLCALGLLSICSARRPGAEAADAPSQPRPGQYITVACAPDSVSFAGERIPLEYYDVRESLEREMNAMVYGHNLTIYTLRLAGRFFPEIEAILREEGVPDDFKYLCVAESNLQNLVSPARAAGFWQFLTGTARQYGLEVNEEVDERYHLAKATRAACRYLREAYERYGNWTLAAASYNVGRAHLDRQIEAQGTRSYFDMALNIETARYLYRMISYKIIMEEPERYGFHIAPGDRFRPLEYTQVSVSEPVPDLAAFAAEHGTNYKMLKLFNPWLRKPSLQNKSGRTYRIRIPAEGFRTAPRQ